MDRAIGSDISFYQDDNTTPQGIDFDKMAVEADFVIIRAGQNNWIDPDFKENWQAAKVEGIPRGSYWFYDSRVSPYDQAELWKEALDGDLGELPLFPDFEEKYGGAFTGWHYWYEFIEHLKEIMPGKEIGIYTGYYYWKDNAPKEAASLEYFKQYPLWIARYKADEPLVPAPWDTWTFWQFTDKGDGEAWGVESKSIDLNYYNGDIKEFIARFLSDLPPTNGEELMYEENEILKEKLQVIKDSGLPVNELNLNLGGGAIQVIEEVVDPPHPIDPPPAQNKYELVNPRPNGFVPFYRRCDVNDSKILVYPTNIVKDGVPPSRFWNSQADLANIMREWMWVPGFNSTNAGGKFYMMPEEYTTVAGKPCDNWYGGAFVLRKNVKKI